MIDYHLPCFEYDSWPALSRVHPGLTPSGRGDSKIPHLRKCVRDARKVSSQRLPAFRHGHFKNTSKPLPRAEYWFFRGFYLYFVRILRIKTVLIDKITILCNDIFITLITTSSTEQNLYSNAFWIFLFLVFC